MTDTSEQLAGFSQPVLRTMREKLWIDPEVVERVQEAMVWQAPEGSREDYVTLLISDVKAMLAPLSGHENT